MFFSFFLPQIAYACGLGQSSVFESLFTSIFFMMIIVLPLSLLFYALLRLVPKLKAKGDRWALTRTLVFGLTIAVPIGWFVFRMQANALCL